MDGKYSISLFLLLSIMSLLGKCYSSSEDHLKTYIIYTGNIRNDETSSMLHHKNLLQQIAGDSQEPKPVLQHYKRSFSGFVANLTKEEAKKMAGLDGVVSVFRNEKSHLLTTKSWDFIGLTQYVETLPSESDVIVGVLDTGIWPESISFNDKGFSSPPTKWKGTCDTSNFPCNNKIIGAKHYLSIHDYPLSKNDIESPRDSEGHGTHTASTAAGNLVHMASMLGFAPGSARGGAPSARIAVYKICWSRSGCLASNILAAFDDAIADGVDILSLSVGGYPNNMICCKDAISIGSFHAMQRGVLTVMSAGNDGPSPSSLNNFSPWAIVVGASTLDRKLVTKVKLGNNRVYEGISLNTFNLKEKLYPLIYGGDAPNTKANITPNQSRFCSTNSLNDKLVKGKIILCEGSSGADEAFRVGAVGVLNIPKPNLKEIAQVFPLPACSLQSKDFFNILKYMHSARSPTATIFRTNELNDTLAPVVASFSSRGPSKVIADILKPDLTAPGVNIIASWPTIAPISNFFSEKRKLEFNILSGTSMSCPHVSGAAAYIKSFHPTWSPAALRSALMTTAKHMSSESNGDAEFGYGAGQINPVKALTPGLIYDAQVDDYIRFLCGQGISTKNLQLITRDDNTCSNKKYGSTRDLNYPSFALKVTHLEEISGSFRRTVTNVGSPISIYRAIVTAPEGLNIKVTPNILSFTSIGEMKSYTLTIDGAMKKAIASASLVWDDGNFKVRSPIVVYYEEAHKSVSSPTSYVRVIAILVGFAAIILIYIFIVIITKYRKRDKIP